MLSELYTTTNKINMNKTILNYSKEENENENEEEKKN